MRMGWRTWSSLSGVVLLTASVASYAGESGSSDTTPPTSDARQLVSMPAQAQQILRKDMTDHLAALNQVLGHLAASEFQQASELAESRLGRSSMGRHRGSGMGPGRFMPPEMHGLAMGMHQAASEFAVVARKQDLPAAYSGIQRVTSFCVACHASFRIR